MATRRAKGEGSIYKLTDGRWAFAIIRGGKRRIVTGKTKAEATKKGSPLKTMSGTSEYVGPYLQRWLDRKATLSDSARANYKFAIEGYILPHLGRMKLERLTAGAIEGAYHAMGEAGASPATIRKVHTVLSSALTDAERRDEINKNPCRLVELAPAQPHAVDVWGPDKVRWFIRESAGTKYHALFVLMLTTGMRPGELFALTWEDVNLDRKIVFVTKSLRNVEGRRSIVEPKSKAGRRPLPIPEITVNALRAHRPAAASEKDLVFPNSIGGALQKSAFRSRVWIPLLIALKLYDPAGPIPPTRLYDLRHTANALLGYVGAAPKAAQERMGHSSFAITYDVYGHSTDSLQRGIADGLELLFPSENPK
jgi:integrase